MDDGFKEYYEHCVLNRNPDKKPRIYYDFKEYNSFDYDVLDAFAKYWK
jgi:hypothetical protein